METSAILEQFVRDVEGFSITTTPPPTSPPDEGDEAVAVVARSMGIGPGLLPGWDGRSGRASLPNPRVARGWRPPTGGGGSGCAGVWVVVATGKARGKGGEGPYSLKGRAKLRWASVVRGYLFILRDVADYYAKASLKRAARHILDVRNAVLLDPVPHELESVYGERVEDAQKKEEKERAEEEEEARARRDGGDGGEEGRNKNKGKKKAKTKAKARRAGVDPIGAHTHILALVEKKKVWVFGFPSDRIRRQWMKSIHTAQMTPSNNQ